MSGPVAPDGAGSAAGIISFVPGVTAPREAAGHPAPASPAVSAGDVPLDETRIATGARAFATMIWDDGTRQALYGRTLFGRNPAPEEGALAAPIRDETLSLSKTHFELGAEADGVWVVDRHSTNGVVVRRGADRRRLVPGQRTAVSGGDILEFGDRHVMVEVLR